MPCVEAVVDSRSEEVGCFDPREIVKVGYGG